MIKASIIKIGNSKGLRLSKQLLNQYAIKDEVELILEKDQIILRPLDEVRKGWDEAFKEMAHNNEDTLLINDVLKDDSFEEWT